MPAADCSESKRSEAVLPEGLAAFIVGRAIVAGVVQTDEAAPTAEDAARLLASSSPAVAGPSCCCASPWPTWSGTTMPSSP